MGCEYLQQLLKEMICWHKLLIDFGVGSSPSQSLMMVLCFSTEAMLWLPLFPLLCDIYSPCYCQLMLYLHPRGLIPCKGLALCCTFTWLSMLCVAIIDAASYTIQNFLITCLSAYLLKVDSTWHVSHKLKMFMCLKSFNVKFLLDVVHIVQYPSLSSFNKTIWGMKGTIVLISLYNISHIVSRLQQ